MVALKRPYLSVTCRQLDARSRNAVVALKPGDVRHTHPCDRWKQERRGGIETRTDRKASWLENREAGTPWWH